MGKELGYSGTNLQDFVNDERSKQETIIKQKFERETRQIEREERQLDREEQKKAAQRAHELEMASIKKAEKALELELAIKQKEILEQKSKIPTVSTPSVNGTNGGIQHPKVKIPPFQENRDNMDAYIDRFERFAKSQQWPKQDWAFSLSALLQGKALDVYSRMSVYDISDYDKVKSALLKRYEMTEDAYRVKFRTSRPEKSETPTIC